MPFDIPKQKKASKHTNSKLTRATGYPFKIAITRQLDNNFCFKDLDKSGLKDLHNFIDETVGKHLTISEVDKLFKRKRGPIETIEVNGQEFQLMHYGKDRKKFRIFGFYSETFFHITKIDSKHDTH